MHEALYKSPPKPMSTAAPSISYVQPGDRSARARIIDAIERLSGRGSVEAIYRQLKQERFNSDRFFARALEIADINYSITGVGESAIPRHGPLVIVANHPFGVVDGLILCDIASRLRQDFRILVHALLCRDDDLAPCFLPIDFRDNREAVATNIRSKREAKETLAEGGVVLVFPAGGISTRSHRGFGPLEEFPWSTFTAKLVAQSRASVIPVFFHGSNSRLFHIASGLHESLRASLLLHEARNKIGKSFRVHLGMPLGHAQLAHLNRSQLTSFLQEHTSALGELATARQ